MDETILFQKSKENFVKIRNAQFPYQSCMELTISTISIIRFIVGFIRYYGGELILEDEILD